MRDDHYKQEKKIVKYYAITYVCLIFNKVALLTSLIKQEKNECTMFCTVVLGMNLGVGIGLFLYIIISMCRL